MHEHTCIKPGCAITYKDADPDPYYCASCKLERDAIAKTIDDKNKGKIRKKPKSLLQQYDESPKARGFVITRL